MKGKGIVYQNLKKKNYFAVKAFHLKWAELPLEANVSKWAVTVLNLDRMRRHLDRATLNMFWEVLDKYVFIRRHYCISFTALSMLHHSTCTVHICLKLIQKYLHSVYISSYVCIGNL